jgi:hypothetical protein
VSLVHLHAKVVERRNYVACVGRLQGVWPVRASKSAKYKVTQKTVTFEMPSGNHVQLAALRNRDLELQPRHLVIMDQWNGQQRAFTIKMFYMLGFLQFLLGFSRVSVFFLCHLVQDVSNFPYCGLDY